MAIPAVKVPVQHPAKKIAPITEGDVLLKRFEIQKQLGQGGFGAVFITRDKKTGETYALKVELEPPKEDEPGLHLEIGVLKRLQGNKHFVRYIDDGKCGKATFLVMQLVGKNLNEIRRNCPQLKFSEGCTLFLAWHCLEAIEAMHWADLLHRDIKPANFAMGRNTNDCRMVYLLDFGLVRRYRLKDGKVRTARPICGFRGTLKYASLNCHKGVDLGRVDDIWSWLYMVVEFMKSEIPWRMEIDRKKIMELKAQNNATLCNGLEPEWRRISQTLDTLKYADEPPYKLYRKSMHEIMVRKRFKFDDPLDWQEKGQFYSHLKNFVPTPQKAKPVVESTETFMSESSVNSSSSEN